VGRDTLFALGLLLSMASQLRLAGSSILGPGESCLALWVLLSVGREFFRSGSPMTPALGRMLTFWALFAVAESLGTVMGAALQDDHDPQWFMHDVLAYLLLAAVSCLSVAGRDAAVHLRRIAWILVTLGSASLVLQLAASEGLVTIPGMDPWYWDRLRGWAATPNQLSLVCIALILLSLHLAETTAFAGRRAAALACTFLPVYAGWLTKSDTFNLVVAAATPAYVALKFRNWLLIAEPWMSLRSGLAWMTVIALPVMIALLVPFGSRLAGEMGSVAKQMSKDNGKGTEQEAALRFHLWNQAIGRGIDAGLLGLGPGPHLGIPTSLVSARQSKGQPKNIEHPTPGGIRNFEAHNTLLDLFVQGGLLADASFLWIAASTIVIGYRARRDALTILVASLCVFGLMHLIIRQPTFWYAIGFCLVASTVADRDARRLRRTLGIGGASRPLPDGNGVHVATQRTLWARGSDVALRASVSTDRQHSATPEQADHHHDRRRDGPGWRGRSDDTAAVYGEGPDRVRAAAERAGGRTGDDERDR
jgi:hypothetical protein